MTRYLQGRQRNAQLTGKEQQDVVEKFVTATRKANVVVQEGEAYIVRTIDGGKGVSFHKVKKAETVAPENANEISPQARSRTASLDGDLPKRPLHHRQSLPSFTFEPSAVPPRIPFSQRLHRAYNMGTFPIRSAITSFQTSVVYKKILKWVAAIASLLGIFSITINVVDANGKQVLLDFQLMEKAQDKNITQLYSRIIDLTNNNTKILANNIMELENRFNTSLIELSNSSNNTIRTVTDDDLLTLAKTRNITDIIEPLVMEKKRMQDVLNKLADEQKKLEQDYLG